MDLQQKYGRGRRPVYSRPHWRRPDTPKETPPPPYGTLIESLVISDLSEPATAFARSARVTGCKLLASYSWLNKKEPTILIPGTPARWTPLPGPTQLAEDNDVYFHDNNSARYPEHPMEPAVRAILAMNPEPLPKQVNLVACGSTIGSLLRFIRKDERPFRMLVEVVGNVVHLIRRENSPKETIPNVKGYGHTFPEAYTTWDADVRGSISHQRLLRYDFGGLSCIVRHEGDGYFQDKLGTALDVPSPPTDNKTDSIEELLAHMDDDGFSLVSSRAPSRSPKLQLQLGGSFTPQSAVFELKTRSAVRKGQDFLGEQLPRMWVARVPSFVLAYHERGLFKEIEVMDVSKKIEVWEKSMNKELSQLAALLHRIIGLARSSRDGKLEIVRQEVDKLEIRCQVPGLSPAFSSETMAKWEAWLAAESDSEGEGQDDEDDLKWSDDDGDYTACSEACQYCGNCTY